MNELKNCYCTSYLTRFSCDPEKGNTQGRKVDMGNYACYSACGGGFTRYKGKQKFHVIIYKGTEKLRDRKSHFCIFSTGQILEHLEALNLIFDENEFKVLSLTEGSDEITPEDHYDLEFIINSDEKIIFAFILTWIRYLWEIPYVFALIESFNLKMIFPELDPFSRFNMARVSISVYNWGTGHSATQGQDRLYSIEELKERLHNKNYDSLNYLYDGSDKDRSAMKRAPKEINGFKSDNDLEYWTDSKAFEERIEIYKANKKNYDSHCKKKKT